MIFLYCATCGYYMPTAKLNIATRIPGRLVYVDGSPVVRIGGGFDIPKEIAPALVENAYCMVCAGELERRNLDVCPHEADDRYWVTKTGETVPVRVCDLCQERQTGTYIIVWPEE